MTADFFQRNKAGVLLTVFLSFSIFFLTLRVDPYVLAIKKVFLFFLYPEVTWSGEFFNRVDSVRGRIFELGRAEGENYILRRQNSNLSKGIVERDALQEENNRLRVLLDLKTKKFSNGIIAEVLAREPREWFHTLLINKGSKDGIRLHSAVVDAQAELPRLLGRIIELTAKTSKVLLITDVDSAISVSIRNKNELALLEGANSPFLNLNYLAQTSAVEKGDDIITAGLGGIIPPGLFVGKVSKVSLRADGFFKEAQVLPASEFYSVREVLVINREDVTSAP